MKKNLGVVQAVYPMPVLMVAAYDENGKVATRWPTNSSAPVTTP